MVGGAALTAHCARHTVIAAVVFVAGGAGGGRGTLRQAINAKGNFRERRCCVSRTGVRCRDRGPAAERPFVPAVRQNINTAYFVVVIVDGGWGVSREDERF